MKPPLNRVHAPALPPSGKGRIAPEPLLAPTFMDFALLLGGVALSQYLAHVAPLSAEVPAQVTAFSALNHWARSVIAFLPGPLRLTEGIVLLGPVFYLLQLLRGRSQPLTGAEWLWAMSWAGLFLTTGLVIGQQQGLFSAPLAPYASKPRLLWYLVFVPSIGVLAGVLTLTGLFSRGPAPWTHSLALALALWPIVPLVGILASGGNLD